MKNSLYLIALMILVSCLDTDVPLKEEELSVLTFADSIAGNWVVDMVTKDAHQRDEWIDFELRISVSSDSAGSFEAMNVPEGAEMVWPLVTEWTRIQKFQLNRSDTVIMNFKVDSLELNFEFDLPEKQRYQCPQLCDSLPELDTCRSCKQTLEFIGPWVFDLKRKEL